MLSNILLKFKSWYNPAFKNSVDPDQLAKKPADQDLHCLLQIKNVRMLIQVIKKCC